MECQDDIYHYHPCKQTKKTYRSVKYKFSITECDVNPNYYISPYTKRFECVTIPPTVNETKSGFQFGKCELRFTAVNNQKNSTILDKDVYLDLPCQKPLVKWISALNTTTSECKSETFPDIKYQHLFKCQTIWRPTKLSNGTITNIGVGCEARFKHDCRNNHSNCNKPVSDPATMTKKVVFRRNKKQYQRKQLIQG